MIRIILPLVCAALGLAAASCSQSGDPFATAEAPASPHPSSHGAASAAMAPPPNSPQTHAAASSPPATTDQTPARAAQPAAASPDASPSDQVPQDQVPSLDEPPPPSSPKIASPSTAGATPPSTMEASPGVPTSTPTERRASTLIGMPVVSADGSPLGDVKDIVFDQQGRATHLVIAYGAASDASPGDITGAAKPAPGLDGKLTAMPWDAAAASIKEGRVVLDGSKLQDAPSFTALAWPNLDDPGWSGPADAYWRKAVRAAIAAHPGAPIDSTTRQRARRARDEQ